MTRLVSVNSTVDHTELIKAWTTFLLRLFPESDGRLLPAPSLISDEILARSGYLEHFPHQVLTVSLPHGVVEECFTPAACLHVYPRLQGTETPEYSTCISGQCTRFEGGRWQPPYRLKTFQMFEFVLVGTETFVQNARTRLRLRVQDALDEIGLDGKLYNSTDAFFLGQDDGAQRIQQLKGLKQEYRVEDGDESIALASLNDHEDYFGRRFDIHAGGDYAHSFCAAFGLDRLTAFARRLWGPDRKDWPERLMPHARIS